MPIENQKRVLVMIARMCLLLIFVCSAGLLSYAQQSSSPCQQPAADIAKGELTAPLKNELLSVTVVGGRVSGSLLTAEPRGISQLCLALFTERKHKFVANAVTDEEGEFLFRDIPAGRYRIVIRAPGFFVAEIPVRVLKKAKESKRIDIVLQSPVIMNSRG